MPVRKIPKNYLGVTGGFASQRNDRMLGFESTLEKDLHILLEYDPSVDGFEEQPVRIPFVSASGHKTSYPPDILIHYHPPLTGKARKPVLGEVKTQAFLDKYAEKYAPKFEAARAYAAEQDWEFRIFTEREIRIPRLETLKFLRAYHHGEPSTVEIDSIALLLESTPGGQTYDQFISYFHTDDELLQALPVLWHMVAKKRVVIDLDKPISGDTLLELAA